MVVLDAQRYGLAQLHQLRGRVGRGAAKSFCILVYPDDAGERARLEILTRSTDGFEIAEEDLRLRGPGRARGHRAIGREPNCGWAICVRDFDVYRAAKLAAGDDRRADPRLARSPTTPGCARCSQRSLEHARAVARPS